MKHFFRILLLVSAFALMSGQAFAEKNQSEWTFLLFLNGNNNLDTFGTMNLKQMEQVGSTDDVNIIVQWASMAKKDVKRMRMLKSTNPKQVTSPAVETLSNVDMGDYKELVNFITWGAKKYPAKKLFVAVWNHGNGWHVMNRKKPQMGTYDISYDDKTGNRITTEELGQALREASANIGQKIDVYGSDACLMAMAEVAAEMKDSVDYLIGSEDTEPGEGWAYHTFLAPWVAKPTMDGKELAQLISKAYVKAYSPGGAYSPQDVTYSVFDLSKLDAFSSSVTTLVQELKTMNADEIAKFKKAGSAAMNFTYSDYRDFGSLLTGIEKAGIVRSATLSIVRQSLSSVVVANDKTKGYAGSTGMSVWMPVNDKETFEEHSARYNDLTFNKDSNWIEAIRLLQ